MNYCSNVIADEMMAADCELHPWAWPTELHYFHDGDSESGPYAWTKRMCFGCWVDELRLDEAMVEMWGVMHEEQFIGKDGTEARAAWNEYLKTDPEYQP